MYHYVSIYLILSICLSACMHTKDEGFSWFIIAKSSWAQGFGVLWCCLSQVGLVETMQGWLQFHLLSICILVIIGFSMGTPYKSYNLNWPSNQWKTTSEIIWACFIMFLLVSTTALPNSSEGLRQPQQFEPANLVAPEAASQARCLRNESSYS